MLEADPPRSRFDLLGLTALDFAGQQSQQKFGLGHSIVAGLLRSQLDVWSTSSGPLGQSSSLVITN